MSSDVINVVFLASRLAGADEIDFDAEFDNIQSILDRIGQSGRVRVRFYKNVTSDNLWELLRPPIDILQLSAHGDANSLAVFDSVNGGLRLTGKVLADMLVGRGIKPGLVILNACESSGVAKDLLAASPFVIGTTQEITDRAAIMIGGILFERLAEGASLGDAHNAAKALLAFIDQGRCDLVLHSRQARSPASTTFGSQFRILAALPDLDDALERQDAIPPEVVKRGKIKILFGVAGAASDVTQLVLYTDDPSFTEGQPPNKSREKLLSWIIVGHPADGEIWIDEHDPAWLDGDCRWFASAPTTGGTVLAAGSTVIEALERHYFHDEWRGKLPPAYKTRVVEAINHLAKNRGGRKRGSVRNGIKPRHSKQTRR